MAYVNYVTKNMAIKIVYYGPGLSGKTTNLRYIYFKLEPAYRGELVCLETPAERTFFFDLLPIKAGLIKDFKVHFQLLTVPGQVFYEASRKSVLKGADGIVFVADSQLPLLEANLESFDGLRKSCLEQGIDLNRIPLVFQYNKRDLPNLIPVETFNRLLNSRNCPYIEAEAINGRGVLETLKEIARLTVPVVRASVFGENVSQGEKAREGPAEHARILTTSELRDEVERPASKRKAEKKPEEAPIEFVKPGNEAPFPTTRIKVQSIEDIEQEIERLSREFGLAKKK
ncbi:MAG TPA: GTPase domain-containing protein [Candidatus Saccharicenans sp.]|jgi:signal recognition particle receptor subunit beta|nr:GTPase domain-containing protein [Candidatus Saccharicenans sp.]HOT68109.1 GTPase domain-containing protein [Candidatus Saccharicenans sp.]HQE64365.1 GTPase domain-containing protein [Candidatus Saccharicenans sp.]HQI22261.1 GTPase domain-containing protein [Candidatus Saccharicenans sp.]HRT26037.1 GTPase domain-containing protein [Candidatus Saccharicenans sp.]